MKLLVAGLLLVLTNTFFGQRETEKWVVSPKATLDFSGGTATLQPNSSQADFLESSACISDKNGNLLFYTDGYSIWGKNHAILPNGDSLTDWGKAAISTSTQGCVLIQKPKSSSIYYLFSLPSTGESFFKTRLTYSIIDKNLNNGIGDVVSKKNSIIADTLLEKMAVTKHCNKKDYWLVIVKLHLISLPYNYELEFLSYLITENGINNSPVRSQIKTTCPDAGQLKFNNAGTELAYAEGDTLTRLNFDKETGHISLKQKHTSMFKNIRYGVEYAPNDSIIYVHTTQYHLYSQLTTSLSNIPTLSQLQRGIDGKIYCFQTLYEDPSLPGVFTYIADGKTYITTIQNPNLSGVACGYTPNSFIINHPSNNKLNMAFPYFPSYYFDHKQSNFSYSGSCANTPISFYLEQPALGADSVVWFSSDLNQTMRGDTVYFSFPYAGSWTVESSVFKNGVVEKSTQCVTICGNESVSLPKLIDLCDTIPFEINPLSPCGISYKWNTGDTTSALFIDKAGTYILSMTTTCGTFSDTMEVIKSNDCGNESVSLPKLIDLCDTVPFMINPLSPCGISYKWNTGETTSALFIEKAGIYILSMTTPCGIYKDTMEVIIGDDCAFSSEIPNVFSANGDGVNDEFTIRVTNATSFHYSIFNRWGEVFKSGEVQIPSGDFYNWSTFTLWDGKSIGEQKAVDGVYYYKIEFNTLFNKIESRSGFLHLIR